MVVNSHVLGLRTDGGKGWRLIRSTATFAGGEKEVERDSVFTQVGGVPESELSQNINEFFLKKNWSDMFKVIDSLSNEDGN